MISGLPRFRGQSNDFAYAITSLWGGWDHSTDLSSMLEILFGHMVFFGFIRGTILSMRECAGVCAEALRIAGAALGQC